MSRQVYVYRDGRLVPKHLAAPLSSGPGVHIISDTMEPLRHPITGKLMDSKSEFRRVTKAHGCEEVGNDAFPARVDCAPGDPRPDIKRAIEELKSR